MPSMLRFPRGDPVQPAAPPHPKGHQPCPRSSSPAPAASSAATSSRAARRRPPRRRARPRRRRRARWSSSACPARPARSVEIRIGDVTRPDTLAPALAGVDAVVHLVAIPRDFNGGADLRLVNTEGTRAVVAAMRAAGVRRLVHMGAMGVEDDPTLHYASSKAKAEALVRESGLDWTILKPSLQFGEGDGFFNIIAGLVRLSPGRRPGPGRRLGPLPADPRRRRRGGRRSGRSPTRRRSAASFELGGPRYWTYREITREVLSRARQAAGHPADAGPAHPARRRRPRSASTSRSRSPPTSSASSSSTTSARSTSSRRGSASSRGRWRARSAISRTRSATRSPSRSDRPIRRGPHDPAALGRSAALIWVAIVVVIALGAAGLVAALDHPPGSAGRPELTGRRRRRGHARSSTRPRRISRPSPTRSRRSGPRHGARWPPSTAPTRPPSRRRSQQGDRLVSAIDHAHGQRCAARSPTCPYVGTPEAGLTVSDAVVARHARAASRRSTRPTASTLAWARLTSRVGRRQPAMSRLLAEHDRLVVAAAEQRPQCQVRRRRSRSSTRPRRRSRRPGRCATSWPRRSTSRSSTSGSTERRLRRRAAEPVHGPLEGRHARSPRRRARRVAAEAEARAQLPPDTRGLVIIMAEIGRGGMNRAVIAIEEARAS